ncbi:MAG: ABC transporter ATP-binding protein [Flavobacteriales bacterium]|nr:ABC transporter ATP-binding protein [Flavobacteriales bacterium]
MSNLLETHDLCVGHSGKAIVNGVDMSISSGELVALIGLNGSGKSTLLRTLMGFIPPVSGVVKINGVPLTKMNASERAKAIAVVLTDRPSAGLLDVGTLIALGRQPWTGRFGHHTAKDRAAVKRAMERTGTTAFATRALDRLSDGEAQRVMIARALSQDTPLLILDEPTAFLDLVNRVQVFRLLRELAHKEGKGVLLSTHDLQTALDQCDRVVLITGASIWSGTTAEARSSGVLERTFASDGLRFDPESGAFKVV